MIDDFLGLLTKDSLQIQKNLAFNKPCPKCGSKFEDMVKTEKIGCSYCYDHFGESLQVIIKKTQWDMQHVGKIPKNWKRNSFKNIFRLKKHVLLQKQQKMQY